MRSIRKSPSYNAAAQSSVLHCPFTRLLNLKKKTQKAVTLCRTFWSLMPDGAHCISSLDEVTHFRRTPLPCKACGWVIWKKLWLPIATETVIHLSIRFQPAISYWRGKAVSTQVSSMNSCKNMQRLTARPKVKVGGGGIWHWIASYSFYEFSGKLEETT